MSTLKLEKQDAIVMGMLNALYPWHEGKCMNPFDVKHKEIAKTVMNHLWVELSNTEGRMRGAVLESNRAKTKKYEHMMTAEYFELRSTLYKTLYTTLKEYYFVKGFIDSPIDTE